MSTKTEASAFELMSLLLDGPADKASIIAETGWSEHQFSEYLGYLRTEMCPTVNAVVPRPTHDDGYRYHIIDAEHPNRPAFWRGSAASTTDLEARLRTLVRLYMTYLKLVDGRTTEGRRVKLVEQRLRHTVEDLDLMEEMNAELQAVSA